MLVLTELSGTIFSISALEVFVLFSVESILVTDQVSACDHSAACSFHVVKVVLLFDNMARKPAPVNDGSIKDHDH